MTEPAFDLIPGTCEASNLRTLLPESKWRRIRAVVAAGGDRQCVICGGRGRNEPGVRSLGQVDAHEWWSYDDNAHVQRLVSIECLCPDCHQAVHWPGIRPPRPISKNRFERGPGRSMLTLLERAGWSVDQLDEHHEVVLSGFLARSKHVWVLDLTSAANFGVDLGVLTAEERVILHPSSRPARLIRNLMERDRKPGPTPMGSLFAVLTAKAASDGQ